MTISNYPDELKNLEKLSRVAESIVVGSDTGIRTDLTLISFAAKEMLSVSVGLAEVAKADPLHALGFVGLPIMGAFWLGYQRALKDISGGKEANQVC